MMGESDVQSLVARLHPRGWRRDEVPDPLLLTPESFPLPPSRAEDFVGLPHGEGDRAADLGLLLLDLYDLAERTGIGQFELAALTRLQRYIPFDSAWIGEALVAEDGPIAHNGFLFALPAGFFPAWKAVRHCDPLSDPDRHEHGRAMITSAADPQVAPAFRAWAERFGLASLLRISACDRKQGLATFLSIYRRDADRPFTPDEARRMELAIPHLAAALELNRLGQIRRAGGAVAGRALCDGYGYIHQQDEGFARVAGSADPAGGPVLPGALALQLRGARETVLELGTHRIRCTPVSGLWLLEALPRSPVDLLSPRERTVIILYGGGLSYKEVARRMDLSPTTVRHYLREAYRKLGVRDKAELASLLALGAGQVAGQSAGQAAGQAGRLLQA